MSSTANLFDRPWRFVTGAPSLASLPPEGPLEVAFAGRSNVGKSSLINALTGQKALARTSNTPGRTQHLNFFVPDDNAEALPAIAIVDMPGYGFAKAPKAQVEAWTRLIRAYLRGRASLRRVFVLIDARHGIKPNDEDVLSLLDKAAVSYQIVLTKADKLKQPALQRIVADTLKRLAKRPAAFPDVIVTSAEKRNGIDELRETISGLLGN
jgi:GTP-binding protein